ncbi:MAG: tryptophan--tRNA ligase, partial [Oscillospiraceae bacterium]|nr:tryptophan--tRNA ligase [Oscillospiraceae bacterium]
KSDANPNAVIFIMDGKDEIMKKCKRAVTDSEPCVRYDPQAKPGVSNLMTLYNAATGKSFEEIEREFEGQGYGVFKPAVGEAVDAMLSPVREKAAALMADRERLDAFMRLGAGRASDIASGVLSRVKDAMGFYGV